MSSNERKFISSFDGKIHEIPEICLDNFEDPTKRAYFLSHCHTDHTVGLYDLGKQPMFRNAVIYMSELTMDIVKCTFKRTGISSYIQPLKLGAHNIKIDEELEIEVTLIEANHCLGSVMFLFRAKGKTILFTGDFRIHKDEMSNIAELHENGEPIKIDVMYVDTTFNEEIYNEFSQRSESIEQTIATIDNWLKQDPKNRISIHTSGKYVAESLFQEIHKQLGLKVVVSDKLYEIYRNFPVILEAVTERDDKIHLCLNIRERAKCWHDPQFNYLSLHLSATQWGYFKSTQKPLREVHFNTKLLSVDVCYATHCSRSELTSFIDYFSPGSIIGFPKPYIQNTPQKKSNNVTVSAPKKRPLPDEERKDAKKVKRDLSSALDD